MLERGIIKTYFAPQLWPNADQGSRKRRFSGTTRANDSKSSPLRNLKEMSIRIFFRNPELDMKCSTASVSAGGGKAEALLPWAEASRSWSSLSPDCRAPTNFSSSQWRFRPGQCACGQYRARNNDAPRQFLVDNQVGANSENQRLQKRAEDLDSPPRPLATSLAASWAARYFWLASCHRNAACRRIPMACRTSAFRLPSAARRITRYRKVCKRLGRTAVRASVRNVSRQARCHPTRRDAYPEMKQETNAKIDRHPWEIE